MWMCICSKKRNKSISLEGTLKVWEAYWKWAKLEGAALRTLEDECDNSDYCLPTPPPPTVFFFFYFIN